MREGERERDCIVCLSTCTAGMTDEREWWLLAWAKRLKENVCSTQTHTHTCESKLWNIHSHAYDELNFETSLIISSFYSESVCAVLFGVWSIYNPLIQQLSRTRVRACLCVCLPEIWAHTGNKIYTFVIEISGVCKSNATNNPTV